MLFDVAPSAVERGGAGAGTIGIALGLVTACVTFAAACSAPNTLADRERVIPMEPFAESRAPYGRSGWISLISDSVACLVDRYQIEVYCSDPHDTLWKFGGQGEGPGEFGSPSLLARGPDGTLATFDLRLNRASIFRTNGPGPVALVSSSPMLNLIPTSPVSSAVEGTHYDLGEGVHHQVEVEFGTGRILWSRHYSPALVKCGEGAEARQTMLGRGHPEPGGGRFFVACRGQYVVWFADRNERRPSAVVASPTYRVDYPNERDVAAYIETMTALTNGTSGPSRQDVADFRRRPKPWSRGSGQTVDEQGWFWVATTRDRQEYSYIDVYATRGYLGTVRVRHDLAAFDRMGSRLVVLVDRPLTEDDPGGVQRSGIDWYDVSGLAASWAQAPGDRSDR